MTEALHATLPEALYALQQEVGSLPRDAANPFFKSTFSSFPSIKRLVDPIAWKHGLFVQQSLSYDGENDTMLNNLYFNNELAESTIVRLHLAQPNPQNHGSATSYMRRYAYTTCLGLVSDNEDDDGNASSRPAQVTTAPAGATVTRQSPSQQHTVSPQTVSEDF